MRDSGDMPVKGPLNYYVFHFLVFFSSLTHLIITFNIPAIHFLCWKAYFKHYCITSYLFTPATTSIADQRTQMDIFNHHFTVVFWIITSLKADQFTVCGRHGQQHEAPHTASCAAKLISFTLRPNKSFPRPKQNANSTLLRFCMLQSELLCQKSEAGSFQTATAGQKWPLTPRRTSWDPDLSVSFSRVVHGDGGATDFPGDPFTSTDRERELGLDRPETG